MTHLNYTLIALMFSASAFAGNVDMRDGEDCSDRVKPQLSYIQEIICKRSPEACKQFSNVAIVDDDSRNDLSNDPNHPDAQLAESNGLVSFCKQGAGHLNLVERDGRFFAIGVAHGFYNEDGSLKCSDGSADFYPDAHYNGTSSNIEPFKSFKIKMPPLNFESARKFADSSLIPEENEDLVNLNDIVIFEITKDSPLLKSQRKGEDRPVFRISQLDADEVSKVSENNVSLMAVHSNYKSGAKTAIERGCSIYSSKYFVSQLTTCDTGNNASGSALFTTDKNKTPYMLGFVNAESGINIQSSHVRAGRSGNNVIPASIIREQFAKYVGPVTEPVAKEEYLAGTDSGDEPVKSVSL